MKIEIDLTKLADPDGPKLGRVAATALLSALPADEAELAIVTWRAGVDAASDPVLGIAEPEMADTTAPVDSFVYRSKEFSPSKRGPSAAFDRAMKDIESATTIEAVEIARPEWEDLARWLDAVKGAAGSVSASRPRHLRTAVENRRVALRSPSTGDDYEGDTPVEPEPEAGDTSDPDDIPFEVEAAAPTAEPVKVAPPVEQPGNGAIPTAPLDDTGLRRWVREYITHHVTAVDITTVMTAHGGPSLDDMSPEQRGAAAAQLYSMVSQ